MKRIFSGMWLFALIVLLGAIGACASEPISEPATPAPKATATVPAKPAWQDDWAKTLEGGRREGKVNFLCIHGSEFRVGITNAFKEKGLGIDVEWLTGRGAELVTKIKAERSAGLYFGDIITAGITTCVDLSDAGILDPLEPALVLPEVKNPKVWKDNELYFIDKERTVFPFYCRTGSTILINSDMVRPEELKSYRNLLEPKWKGKILMNDPTVAGSGNAFAAMLNIVMGVDFLRELAKQEPVITRDQRQQIEWVARGRYPVLLAPEPPIIAEFQKAGAPIKHIIPDEGTWSGAGGGMLGLLNRPAHPQAAKVFLNWFLSQEGQTAAVKAVLEQSRRLDVTDEYIDDARRLQPGVKYEDGDSDPFFKKRDETRDLSRDIFAAQLK